MILNLDACKSVFRYSVTPLQTELATVLFLLTPPIRMSVLFSNYEKKNNLTLSGESIERVWRYLI
jgi:hypothetical protein